MLSARENTSPQVLLREAASGSRLSEICAPCFALILRLREATDIGDLAEQRRRIVDLLGDVEHEALAAGVPATELKQVKFALVAFVDETMISSDWRHREEWMSRPLQAELYDRNDLGEEFFERLSQMRREPAAHAEVLEVYYLCMALGFKGRYRIHEQNRLRELIEGTYRDLREHARLGDDEPLAPHGRPRGQAATEFKTKLPPWLVAVGAAALCVLIYLGMSLYISGFAGETAQAIQDGSGGPASARQAAPSPSSSSSSAPASPE